MDRLYYFDCFQFNDDFIFHKQIDSITELNSDSIKEYRQEDLR